MADAAPIPCPSCSKVPQLFVSTINGALQWTAHCNETKRCQLYTEPCADKNSAITAWNHLVEAPCRPPEDGEVTPYATQRLIDSIHHRTACMGLYGEDQ